MSIASEITRLTNAKADIKAAIEAKGVTVPAAATLDAYPSYVSQIEGGGGGGDADLDNFLMRSLSIMNTNATFIASSACEANNGLVSVSMPYVTHIGWSAFKGCTDLQTVYAPNLTGLDTQAFSGTALSYLCAPLLSYVGSAAFYYCAFSEVNFPFQIGSYTSGVFGYCRKLQFASLPNQSGWLPARTFEGCSLLESISIPNVGTIGSSAFSGCYALRQVAFPYGRNINPQAFALCSNLSVVVFGSQQSINYVYSSAFRGCWRLMSLYILATSIGALYNINAFSSTPISNYTNYTGGANGSIFVRASLLEAYKTTTNWATYSSRFVGLTDEEIAALPY